MGMLDKIVLFFTGVADIYMVYDFLNSSFERREAFKGKKKLLLTLTAIVIIFCINLLKNTYVNLTVVPMIYFLYVLVMFESRSGNRPMYVLVVYATIFCGEFMLTIFLEIPPRIMKTSTILNLSDIVWQIFTAKLFSYLILTILKQFSGKSRHRMPVRIFLLYICQPIASLAIMIISYYSNMNTTVTSEFKVSMTIGFAFLLLSNILMFYAFNLYVAQMSVNMEQKMTIIKQNADVAYYRQSAQMDKKYRAFIHDTVHYLKIIGELAKDHCDEKIIGIVQDIAGEIEQTASLVYSNNPVLNAVLNENKQAGEKCNVSMDIYVEPGLSTEGISDKDMIVMLGNLLANAIRAASECDEEAYVKMWLFMQKGGDFCVIKIRNPYQHKLVKHGETYLSTKKEPGIHGIGLRNVEETAKKYRGFLQCDAENQVFTVMLVLQVR